MHLLMCPTHAMPSLATHFNTPPGKLKLSFLIAQFFFNSIESSEQFYFLFLHFLLFNEKLSNLLTLKYIPIR